MSVEISIYFSVTAFACLVVYRWKALAEGLPHINNFENESDLPAEVRFSASKADEINKTKTLT